MILKLYLHRIISQRRKHKFASAAPSVHVFRGRQRRSRPQQGNRFLYPAYRLSELTEKFLTYTAVMPGSRRGKSGRRPLLLLYLLLLSEPSVVSVATLLVLLLGERSQEKNRQRATYNLFPGQQNMGVCVCRPPYALNKKTDSDHFSSTHQGDLIHPSSAWKSAHIVSAGSLSAPVQAGR